MWFSVFGVGFGLGFVGVGFFVLGVGDSCVQNTYTIFPIALSIYFCFPVFRLFERSFRSKVIG